jgi:ABC-type nitrate/sulfonate/bicarbonate transport system ATPase subunit
MTGGTLTLSRTAPEYWPAARQEVTGPATGLSLTIRNLGKSFGPRQVLKSLDFHVPAGQFVAIVGKSGCGKSTRLGSISRRAANTGTAQVRRTRTIKAPSE